MIEWRGRALPVFSAIGEEEKGSNSVQKDREILMRREKKTNTEEKKSTAATMRLKVHSINGGYRSHRLTIKRGMTARAQTTTASFAAAREPLRAEQGLSAACTRQYCRNARYYVRC